ncbi:hypothetical protein RIF29_19769 [Crotalaria pallida]|uniref:Uncharacterized protein n=1 Tax=Crotalaria pallida TaxID=3830 RepID=A0AAN9F4C5_CROPI
MFLDWGSFTNLEDHPIERIWVVWKKDMFGVEVIRHSSQLVHCRVNYNHDDSLYYVTFVYAHNDSERRIELWEDLKEIGESMMGKWMLLGDFSCCLNVQEKIGGLPLEPHNLQEFRDMVLHCQLEDMNYCGSFYTWNNNQEDGERILSKLDRVLVNYNWCRDWPDVQAEFGNCGVSDHSPMVIHWSNSERCKGQSFKFLNHLTMDPEFIQIVNHNWSKRREGCAMYRIMRNLEHIKDGLKDLNQRKFKSIDVKEIQAREKLDYIQNLLQSDPMNYHLLKMEKEEKEEHSKVSPLCELCGRAEESCRHLFFECDWSRKLLDLAANWVGVEAVHFKFQN